MKQKYDVKYLQRTILVPFISLEAIMQSNVICNMFTDGDFCKRSIETAGLQVYGSGFYNGGCTSIYASWMTTGIVTLWAVSMLY